MNDTGGFESFENHFRGLSGRGQWLAWLVAMLATGAAVVAGWVVAGSSAGVVIVIACLFLGLLTKSFADISFLDRESRTASKQVRQLSRAGDIEAFLDQASPSVFRSHIAALHTILRTDRHVTQDNLIEIVHARLVARSRVTDLFANILITLGLVGTIVGLIQAIGGLEGVTTADDADIAGISDGLLTTVSGLSTAFYTTLAGAVFGGIILRVLSGVIDSNITGYVAHLSELTEVHVLPAMRRVAADLVERGYYRDGGLA